MSPDVARPRNSAGVIAKVLAWVSWVIFVGVSMGESEFASAIRNDGYFERYYSHHPMSGLTVVMTAHPVWMTLLPLVWLPFVVAFQRQRPPRGLLLLPLLGTMVIAGLVLAVLILCAGPPIQM